MKKMLTRKKRFAALTMACVMTAGCLAGCGKTKEAESGDVPELSVFGYKYEKAAQSSGDYIYEQIQKKVGVNIKPINASQSNWEERLGVLIASGDIPDLFVNKGLENKEVYNKWLNDGILLCLSDYVDKSKYPNISRQLDKFDDLKMLQGDKHYSLPVGTDLNSTTAEKSLGHAIYIRTDWLQKLGLEEPKTLEEFYNVAKAFRENDPNGSGKKDTYGFCVGGVWWLYPIVNAFNTSYEYYYKDNGEWKPECINENMKKAAKFLKQCYDEKLLDPDFVSITNDQKLENFVSGRDGIIFHNGESGYNTIYNQFKSAYPDKDPKTMFTYLKEPLEGFDGTKRVMGSYGYFTATAIRGDIDDKKRDKALDLLEFLCSDEGAKLCSLGEPNVDYKEENGEYISLLPESSQGMPMTIGEKNNSANFLNLVAWNDYKYICKNSQNIEDVTGSIKAFDSVAKTDPLYFVSVTDKVDSAEIKQLKDAVYQGLAKLITQSSNFDADFEAYVKNWREVGGDNYTKALNEGAKNLGL